MLYYSILLLYCLFLASLFLFVTVFDVIKHDSVPLTYPELLTLLVEYSRYEIAGDKGQYYPNRIKQWMVYLKFQYPQIKTLFRELRIFQTTDPIVELLHREVQIHG